MEVATLDEEKAEVSVCSWMLKVFYFEFLQNIPNPDFSHAALSLVKLIPGPMIT